MAELNDDHPERSYAIDRSRHGPGFDVMLLGNPGNPGIRVSTHDTQQEADAEVARLIGAGLSDSI